MLPEFLPIFCKIRTSQGQPIHRQNSTIKGVNYDLEKLPLTRIPASKTRVQIGEEAGSKCKGLTGLPKLKEPRAINVNPRQLKLEKGNFKLFLTKKTKPIRPHKARAANGEEAEQGRFGSSCRGRDFWVPNQVLGQERRRNSKLSHQFFKAGADGLEGDFGSYSEKKKKSRTEQGWKEERRKRKRKEVDPYPIFSPF
ncbi:hypothetical protein SLEP1_g34353 [Rubroshorea leprosula]|uniref:Uncharacterized protein n=1 Tax=Rubroshorea leprosula TaxID=152421 RepID=A0AAV5KJN3_9ROSI|nr:hypothetical protein SLEP1_g34353 [Rubroshorea leprosula]